jgi:predicted P-loop ATPase
MEAIGHSTADAIALASRYHPQAADTFEQVERWSFDAYSVDSFIAQCRDAGVDVSRHDRRRNVNNNVVPLRPQRQPEAAPATLDDLLGPAEDGKLRRPRTDKLTRAVGLVLPLRYNLLTNRIEHDGEPIHGDFLSGLYLDLAQDHAIEVAKERAIDAAMRVARLNGYHPVQDYLNGLSEQLTPEEWAALDLHCFGGEDLSGWGVIHLQRQLIGLVARALDPGCELHTCLVLQSDQQGIGKSTFWKILGGPWFSDSLGDLRDVREDRLQLHSAWIHEWGEIDSVMGKRESETLKRFITSSRDDVRKPYGRGTEQLLRSCGLVGTTNRRDWIKDPTGNRRFPIIQVRTVNLDWVKENRNRIWGSAVAAYRAQQPWHYSSQEALVVSAAAMDYAAADPLRDALESWAEDHPEMDELPIARILYDLPEYWERRRDRELMRQVGLALTSLGWAATGQRIRYLLPDGSRTDKASLWKRP